MANGDSSNAYMADHDETFRKACDDAGVKPSRRQYSKWSQFYGAAARAAGRNRRKDPKKT